MISSLSGANLVPFLFNFIYPKLSDFIEKYEAKKTLCAKEYTIEVTGYVAKHWAELKTD